MRESKQSQGNFHAVSLSGGKDSSYLLLQMIERDMPIDAVLSADTGMEFPEMVEVAMNRGKTIKVGRDAEYPASYVRERFEKLTKEHIEKVLDGISENTTRVYNTKAYLLAALFNVVSTISKVFQV